MKWSLFCFVLFFVAASAQQRPVVTRPESTRAYTTVLTIDGGGFRDLIPTMVCIEIEDSIKRYLLDHPEYLPEDAEIESIDDFDVLLADFFDAMAGVSAGSWATGYLASKGGNGAADRVFSSRNINRRYGRIVPGMARGLEVFFMEYAERFYPGGIGLNITPPTIPQDLLTANLSTIAAATPQVFQQFLPEIPGVNAPFFPVNGLEEVLELFMGDTRLSEMSSYWVVHAYDLIRRRNIYFVHDTTPNRRSLSYTAYGIIRNRPREITNEGGNEDYMPDNSIETKDFYIRDITRASSALPAFHEAKTMTPIDDDNTSYAFIDGSTISNNAALQCLIFLSAAPRQIPMSEIAMLSLGTGIPLLDFSTNLDASALGWLLNNELLSIMSDGSAENIQSQVDFLFYGNPDVRPGQYLRVQTTAELETNEGDALTGGPDVEYLPTLRRMGVQTARRYAAAIDTFVATYVFAENDK